MLAIVPATAVKVADITPDPTVTEGGTVSAAVLLESVTVTPPDPAACDSVTVQVVVHPEFKLAGLQDNKLTEAAANSDSEADCELPL